MKRTRITALLLALLFLATCLVSCGGPSDLLIPPDDDEDTSPNGRPGTGDTTHGDDAGDELTELPSAVVINEVASKNDTLAAPDGGYYDWIELYNGGDETVDLSGWGLSDGKKDLKKFVFPNGTTLAAGAYLVVWTDGVGDDGSSRTGLYAAFGISADGETVYLSDTDGNLRSRLAVPALRKNTTYGRATDASEVFATLSPTPGQTNDGAVTLLAASVLSFTHESGFYAEDFDLGISAPDGYTIYYTTDCTDPATSPTASRLKYDGTVRITDPSGALTHSAAYFAALGENKTDTSYVDQCFVLRACAKDADGNQTVTVTKNYLVGKNDRADLTGIPTVMLTTDATRIYGEDGLFTRYKIEGLEEQVNLTFLSSDGTYSFDQEVGISIRGSSTRGSAQKNLNVVARSAYDGNSVFKENPFPDVAYTKGVVLRHDNMSSMLPGQGYIQDIVSNRDIVTQNSFYVTVFLDGEYFGLYNLYERVNDDFIGTHYGVDPDHVEIVKFGRESDTPGAVDAYQSAMSYLKTADLTKTENVTKLEEMIDLDSLIDLWCVQTYLDNGDFTMSQNISAWRVSDPSLESPANPYADGRWRFIIFDLDYTLCGNCVSVKDAYNRNTFTAKPKNSAIPTAFSEWAEVANFMKSEDLRIRFGRAFLTVMEECDYETVVKPILDAQLAFVKTHGGIYLHRYNYKSSSGSIRDVESFDRYTKYQYDFWMNRAAYIEEYLLDYLGLTMSELI